MLNTDDLNSLRGVTITAAEVHKRNGAQVLRLRLASGGILAVNADAGGGLEMADETSIP